MNYSTCTTTYRYFLVWRLQCFTNLPTNNNKQQQDTAERTELRALHQGQPERSREGGGAPLVAKGVTPGVKEGVRLCTFPYTQTLNVYG